jgi:hypothetical protein
MEYFGYMYISFEEFSYIHLKIADYSSGKLWEW